MARFAFLRIFLIAGAMVVVDSARVSCDASDLTGVWHGDEGGLYYIRQLGNEVWWGGMSTASTVGYLDFFKGLQFTNVFHGTISGTRITGTLVDVPRGTALSTGILTLDVLPDAPSGLTLRKVNDQSSGGFGASVWHNSIVATPPTQCSATPGIRCEYDTVRKNGDRTLYQELKPEKDFAVVFGWISEGLGLSYPATFGRSYSDFKAAADQDVGDGDIGFNVRLDYLTLSPDFWTTRWEYSDGPSIVRAKLRANADRLHCEMIMYGRSDASHRPLLPGWMELGANSILWNGSPIDGDVLAGPPVRIRGDTLTPGMRVRVTGVLNLDCGHCSFDDFLSGHCDDCEDEEPAEIHPVYSVDIIQDWTQRLPTADLTGVWAGAGYPASGDEGTYFVRQLGDKVWWLGLSRDQGRTFANVFEGTISTENLQGGPRQVINGNWADIPLGGSSNSGTLKLLGTLCLPNGCDVRQPISLYNQIGVWEASPPPAGSGFGGRSWEKLYDRVVLPVGHL